MPRTLVTRTPTSPTPAKSTLSIQIGPLTRPPGLILKSKVRMASAAQIAANRRNSLRATGPRTAAGKARSSRNARKHGLYARDEAPSGEDAAALGDLTEAYLETFDPKDAADASLVRRLALTQRRLSRAAAPRSRVPQPRHRPCNQPRRGPRARPGPGGQRIDQAHSPSSPAGNPASTVHSQDTPSAAPAAPKK